MEVFNRVIVVFFLDALKPKQTSASWKLLHACCAIMSILVRCVLVLPIWVRLLRWCQSHVSNSSMKFSCMVLDALMSKRVSASSKDSKFLHVCCGLWMDQWDNVYTSQMCYIRTRSLIRVLVINDNGLWINDFIWDNEYRLIHGWKRFGCERVEFWRWWAKLGLKAKV